MEKVAVGGQKAFHIELIFFFDWIGSFFDMKNLQKFELLASDRDLFRSVRFYFFNSIIRLLGCLL